MSSGFNTQPPEGGWNVTPDIARFDSVSTHSRPKAAGKNVKKYGCILMFQHTAARRRLADVKLAWVLTLRVSTHSRPKAAGHIVQ